MTKIASENEVVAAVREARATKSPFEIVGAGSKQRLGRASGGSTTVLNVSGIKGIVSYEPEELILTVRPGTPVAEIVAVLEAKGQRLGFDP
ncbi:MAG: FAD-binding protein, partial [Rhizomicrobium sp.]